MFCFDLDVELETNLELPDLHDLLESSSALALLLWSFAFHRNRGRRYLGCCGKSLEGLRSHQHDRLIFKKKHLLFTTYRDVLINLNNQASLGGPS